MLTLRQPRAPFAEIHSADPSMKKASSAAITPLDRRRFDLRAPEEWSNVRSRKPLTLLI